ncbi:MAG: 50S ribosomal protein L10 [Nanoarchaeota archaeon]|nr:50S ribosomal protein L10 [Nanoarchaeota archaeon]
MEHKPHIHPWKKEQVAKLQTLFKQYPNIAIINLETLPADTYQIIRKSLRGKVEFVMTRKDFMIKAIEQIKPKNYEELLKNLKGGPALMFTKENPFSLYKFIDKNKTDAYAKPGQTAPHDIGIDEGPTKFGPGPMIAEFGQLGIKTEIKEQKITVKTPKILVETGKIITDKVAAFLQKMDIKPMKTGMDVVLIYEAGEILHKNVLSIDEKVYIAAITQAATESMNLAIHASYFTPETIQLLIKKAYVQARHLTKEAKLLTPETAGEVLALAEAQAHTIETAAKL